MLVCTALRSKTSPIGPDRPIRVGVLSRLPFTKLDPGRRSRTKCESFSNVGGHGKLPSDGRLTAWWR